MESITFDIFENISDVWSEWISFTKNDVFLSEKFHNAIEEAPPLGLVPFYILVKQNNESIGICYFQVKLIQIAESLDLEKNNIKGIKSTVAKRLNFYGMVCGNAMVTGQYGYRFKSELGRDQQFDLVSLASKELSNWLKKFKSIKIGPVLCKDYYKRQLYRGQKFDGFTRFTVQPMMYLDINENWKSYEDYLLAMKTKYRTRAKRAVKKLGNITTHCLTLQELELFQDKMHVLYMNVVDNAGFNLFILAKDYFYKLKYYLDTSIDVVGYFQDEELVGFYTIIYNNKSVDAHFLGYDKELNSSHHLYQNMLYDMINRSIEQGSKKIFMSRTALEIKSSCGAEAEDMFCYIKHSNPLLNMAIKPILNNLVPSEKWTPRSPFK